MTKFIALVQSFLTQCPKYYSTPRALSFLIQKISLFQLLLLCKNMNCKHVKVLMTVDVVQEIHLNLQDSNKNHIRSKLSWQSGLSIGL